MKKTSCKPKVYNSKPAQKLPKTKFTIGEAVRIGDPVAAKEHGNKARKVEAIWIDKTGLHYILTGVRATVQIKDMGDAMVAPHFSETQLMTEAQYQAKVVAEKEAKAKAKAAKAAPEKKSSKPAKVVPAKKAPAKKTPTKRK